MKSNLIIIAILAAAAIWFFGTKSTPPAPTQPSSPEAESAPTGAPLPPPTPAPNPHVDGVPGDRLVIVRGIVRGANTDGLVIEGVSRLPNADAHHIMEDREKEKWGDVLIFERGVLQPSPYIPSLTVGGLVVLRGHPQEANFAKGDRVKIIAVELPDLYSTGYQRVHGYTADFSLEGGKTASQLRWNQQNLSSKGALDSGPRRR